MDIIEAVAKELFTKWQVLPREKALVWEDLSRTPTGLDDGYVLRYNFIRMAQLALAPETALQPGEPDWVVGYIDKDKVKHVDSAFPQGWTKYGATTYADLMKSKVNDLAVTEVQVIARELGLPHANSGR